MDNFTWNKFSEVMPDPTESIVVLGLPGVMVLWPCEIQSNVFWFDSDDNEHKLVAYDWWCYLPEGYT